MKIEIKKPRFRSRIAMFDYDWTLVKPKSGGTFPKDIDDWVWLRENVPEVIKKYYQQGFGIYIFTNQSKEWKKTQIQKALETLDIPLTIWIADKKEYYKPDLYLYNEAFPDKSKIKLDKSFFCGDALGRATDFADSDLKFGENIGVKVISPETMFPFEETSKMQIKPVEYQELVILMGYPGSGKTTYSKIFEDAGYFIVHGDEHKLIKKMIKVGEDAIKNEKSVVFDATNATREKRAVYVELAKKYNLPVRCIFVNTSLEQSIMRNNLREKPVPKIVYNIYNKNFEEPSEDEGFVLIKTE